MKVIGLSGGIGSGKSTVAGFLEELGAVVLDLDKTGHEVLRDDAVRQRLTSEFGSVILDDKGEINRSRLGEKVFNDRDALLRLNAIVHPAIDAVIKQRIADYQRRGVKVVVLEAAAMLEAGRDWQVDEIWVTIAPEAVILKRLAQRSGYSLAEAKARIGSQMTNEDRIRQADVVINNDGIIEQVRNRVKAEWEKLQKRL